MRAYRDRFVDWLTAIAAEEQSLPELLNAFCHHLNDAGFAIRRCSLATETVHPLMRSMRHVWYDRAVDPGTLVSPVATSRRHYLIGESLIDETFFKSGGNRTPQYVASPFYQIELHGELFEPILTPGSDQPYPLFNDLAALGCTAYYGLRLAGSARLLQTISFATEKPVASFKRQVGDLRWSLRLLTLHVTTLMERVIKETLARVYVGEDPGRRVCEGMIGVGDVVSMDAAIWFSDLRGFTTISEGLGVEQLLDRLNAYFDCVVGAIYEQGGEVLKYIGDAVLAVFPVEQLGSRQKACLAALSAARVSETRLAALNADRVGAGDPELAHGIGLHLGEVRYGNIGSRERLDFTVIGREVNIASRIEGVCKQLREPLICSRGFADEGGIAARPLGPFDLKGVAEAVHLCVPEQAA